MAAHGIMFHHFHGGPHPKGQGAITSDELAALLADLGPERILGAGQWLKLMRAGALEDEHICLTFDDNLRCQYDLALPVLLEYGITAFWFVDTAPNTGRYIPLELHRYFMTVHFGDIDDFYHAFQAALENSPWAREAEEALKDFAPESYLAEFPFYTPADRTFRFLRDRVLGQDSYERLMDDMLAAAGVRPEELARGLWMDDRHLSQLDRLGHVIGLHSHNHPLELGDLNLARQQHEYAENAAHLERLLGRPPVAMSHPRNSYSEDTLGLLRRMGISLGFRANMARPRLSDLEFPREDHANLMRRMREENRSCA